MAIWEDHTISVRMTAVDERLTVAELIALGKDLEQAVGDGLDKESHPSFLVDGASGWVKEISVTGDIPHPKPVKKAASRRTRKPPVMPADPDLGSGD